MKKVLVLEDESSIRSFIVINLRRAGYEVVEAETGEEALEKLKIHSDVRVALLDIMLPGIDGFEVCRRIRATNAAIGIIMLTARSQEMDKVTGLMTGADDYVTKPFSIKVLLARIKANIRRSSGEFVDVKKADEGDKDADKIVIRELVIDNRNFTVKKGDREIELSNKEYEVLLFLARNAGQLFTREELLNKVWGYDGFLGDLRTVDVTMSRLRSKIEDVPAEPEYILTKRTKGYYIPN